MSDGKGTPIGRIERATPDDVVALATDVGQAPMQVGAVLWLRDHLSRDAVIGRLAERIPSVRRLRQRLVHTPIGAGRPVWIDDPTFDLSSHVEVHDVSAVDEDDVLELAAEAATARLPSDRPLWRMCYIPTLNRGGAALVVVFHHVLADGIGGLAVLANLVDGDLPPSDDGFPHPPPSRTDLYRDAFRARWRHARHPMPGLRRLRAAASQLKPRTGGVSAARCSLNRPTGPRRSLTVIRTALEPLHRAAKAHGATVNDVLLTAVAGALDEVLATRGEYVTELVISMPVSARDHADPTSLGNEVGAVPVPVPATGNPLHRLEQTARTTRAAKRTARGSSMAILGPIFRTLARLGLFGWFIDRQRLVHTFVTNLRGPASRLSFVGTSIDAVAAIAVVTGNVTMSFAVMSYAGDVTITVIADPDAWPDLRGVRDALHHQLDELMVQ